MSISEPSRIAPLNERGFRLFTYLSEVTSLNLTRVLDVESYDSVLWFSDFPKTAHCKTVLDPDGDTFGFWAEIKKLPEPPVPLPPAVCNGWYVASTLKSSGTEPELLSKRQTVPANAGTGDPAQYEELSDRPDVAAAWLKYLAGDWRPWTERHRDWKRHHTCYSALFTIEQQAKRLGEAYEVLLGIGLLTWITANGERVRRHLITASTNLHFNLENGTITVSAAGDGAKATLEYDMLEPAFRPTPDVIKSCQAALAANADEPFSNPARSALRQWVNATSDQGSYSDSPVQPETITAHPVVTLSPAVILRRRSRRSLISMLQNIASKLKAMPPETVPFGVRRLCEIVGEQDAPVEDRSVTRPTKTSLPGEIYFPLLSNDEQRKIVERLRMSRGVLVQGPPGTGKSQTIANLICHLLAEGNRILVTSQTERALKVLQSKLPEELQPLCVTVLGADETALKNMERSVLGINERHTAWDASTNARRVAQLEIELLGFKSAKIEVETRLRHLREIDFQEFDIVDRIYRGTAARIAERLEAERPQLGWIEDAVKESAPAPLTNDEVGSLLAVMRELPPPRRKECGLAVCIPAAIPSADRFVDLFRTETVAAQVRDKFKDRHSTANDRALAKWTRADRAQLRQAVQDLDEAIVASGASPLWVAGALKDVLGNRGKPWMDLRASLSEEMGRLSPLSSKALRRELTFPAKDKAILRGEAEQLLAHFRTGGGLGWGIFRTKIVKQTLYLTREARVDGKLCDNAMVLEEFVEHLHFERSHDLLWSHLAPHVSKPNGTLRSQLSELEAQLEHLARLEEVQARLHAVRNLQSGRPLLQFPDWANRASVEAFGDELAAADAELNLAEARKAFEEAAHELDRVAAVPHAHPISALLRESIQARNAADFAARLDFITALLRDRDKYDAAKKLYGRLKKAAPILAVAMEANSNAPEWSDRVARFTESWNWRRARSWLDELLGGMDATEAEAEVKRLEGRLNKTLEALAAAKAWGHCLERITEGQRQHMNAWKDAIKRIGKGTGVRADLHRQNARTHMDHCRQAIPAWVMPLYRVAETVSADPEPYDVVIVDEASQSGPEACALMYLAKRCIVVGDDKQISPSAVGVERAQVDHLQEQYLYDIEMKDSFGVEASLFAQANIRFGNRIRLREHFRCMPEIIRFSNDLCYQEEPLLPLKQYPPNRLEPIVLRHVADGYREGTGGRIRNENEAKAVADAICACAANPQYAGKTMGVISLLGELQAKRISEMVMTRLEPKEIEARKLAFGDAYEFQGDERDIIFLSMVTAPNAATSALTGSTYEQRFNVATSRACDQIWLFHSVTTNDLSTHDLRHRLLSYYQSPEAPPPLEPDWTKCDSKFEERVGRIIHERGYRLIPQYEPLGRGGKRLDFVIEGTKGRLAIECDGDAFHSASDDVHNDQVRQRMLERCGWRFWRIRESAFYADRTKSLEKLWKLLDLYGITPHQRSAEPEESAPIEAPVAPPPSPAPPPARPLPTPVVAAGPTGAPPLSLFPDIDYTVRAVPRLDSSVEAAIMQILSATRRVEISDLVLQVGRRKGLGDRSRIVVESALRRLEDQAKVRAGVNYIEKV